MTSNRININHVQIIHRVTTVHRLINNHQGNQTPINWGNNIQTIKVDTNAVNDAKQQLEKNKEKENCKSSGPFWRKTNQNDIKQCLQKGPGGFTFTEDEINETINEYVATTTE
jgi:hypothetical protein